MLRGRSVALVSMCRGLLVKEEVVVNGEVDW